MSLPCEISSNPLSPGFYSYKHNQRDGKMGPKIAAKNAISTLRKETQRVNFSQTDLQFQNCH